MSARARYVTGTFGRLFVVRWRVFVLEHLSVVRRRISQARRAAGAPIAYLSLIPSSPRDFTDEERGALAEYLRQLLSGDCATIHHVIEGEGFVASARRSIVTNLALATAQRGAFHTYATLEEAIEEIAAELRAPKQQLLDEVRSAGLAFPEGG